MNSLSRKIASAVLTQVLSRPCAPRIPRSGSNGEAVNCFVTSVDKGSEPYLMVLGLSGNDLTCIEWDGSSYKIDKSLPLTDFRLIDFRITHYYGLSEVTYTGVIDYLLARATAWPYFKIHLLRALSGYDQYLFNKRKLLSKQRMELLKILVDRALEGEKEHVPIDLMTSLYSIKWFSHPQGRQARDRLEFYLESFVETGELCKSGTKYVVTGHALHAIEIFEEQERKHTANVKMQWRGFWLALAVAALTFIQAGLIKLPPLIDLTSPALAK
jgi:hypothetical protein